MKRHLVSYRVLDRRPIVLGIQGQMFPEPGSFQDPKGQMNQQLVAIYHIPIQSQHIIWTTNRLAGHFVLAGARCVPALKLSSCCLAAVGLGVPFGRTPYIIVHILSRFQTSIPQMVQVLLCIFCVSLERLCI